MLRQIGISIDFYDTLVEIDRDVPTIGQLLTSRGFPCSADVELIWNSQGFDGQVTCARGHADYARWRIEALRSLALLCGVSSADSESVAADLLAVDQRWTVKARPGAAALLASLADRALPYCILTNWDYPLAPYLSMAGLPVNLPAVTSAMLGVRKPHVDAFAAARKLMGVQKEHHIHVGDSWTADVAGAVRSGAWAIWVNEKPPQEPLPRRIRHAQIEDLPEVLDWLIGEIA
jgi:FMN phosphatase YigB (HAD superfamily)